MGEYVILTQNTKSTDLECRKMYLCLSKPIECFTISSEGRKQTFEGSVSSYSLVETNKMDDQECIKSVNFDYLPIIMNSLNFGAHYITGFSF